ncbi:uncharacterized protein UDID_18245 [Ustilago sp. UG-2017a]|nr:uncharacterized protein UDID_18245 [Ustilago sp. UG-2017a]
MLGDLLTPTPVLHPRLLVSFVDPDKCSDADYEKYTSPTGARYLKPWMELYSNEQKGDTSVVGETNPTQSKPLATPFPKFNPKDVKIFILEAEAWFRFNRTPISTRTTKLGFQARGCLQCAPNAEWIDSPVSG